MSMCPCLLRHPRVQKPTEIVGRALGFSYPLKAELMFTSLNRLQPWGAFFLRLVLGAAMIYHGYSKVVPAGGFHGGNAFAALEHHSRYVASLGLPYWMGIVSALTEFVGGILVLLGLLTRFAAILI